MVPAPKPELLLPAGSLEKLKAAFLYGADAVYMGTPDLSLRSRSDLTLDEVATGIDYAHGRGKRVYLTLNLFAHNKDVERLPLYLETLRKVRPDGVIVADPGVFSYLRTAAPELDLHISTQANVCSWQSVKFWQDLGAKLVVLARELSFDELKEIRAKCPDIRLEAFVHGAMCMTYSGRCLLSNFLAERGANQGACANSCRWNYKLHLRLKDGTLQEMTLNDENRDMFEFLLEEGCRPGDLMPIEEDLRGAYILNSKDLNLMPRLGDLLATGIDSLKIEGRGKSVYYVALAARAYRMAIDDWVESPSDWDPSPYLAELAAIPNRGYTLAFHDGRLDQFAHGLEMNENIAGYEFAGVIRDVTEDAFIVEIKNKLVAGDVLEFVPTERRQTMLLRAYSFEDARTGEVKDVLQPGEKPLIRMPFSLFELEDEDELRRHFPPLTIIRKEKPLNESQWRQIDLHGEAAKIEHGNGDLKRYADKRDRLRAAVEARDSGRHLRTPRLGTEGCCGKGCNGCLVFWHDLKYAKARALWQRLETGAKFSRNMREDLIES